MTPVLSTTAWVLHDLGLATSFGGSLFGKVGLHPAVRAISSQKERGQVVDAAWKGFNVFNMVSLGVMGATWLVGRTMLSGNEIDDTTHALVIAKDACVATTVIAGAGAMALGIALGRQDRGSPPPIESGSTPSLATPPRAVALQRSVDVLGYVSLLTSAAALGLTAVLAMRAGNSHKWGLLSRLLP